MSPDARRGFAAALCAYTLWGVLPLYLHLLGFAAPEEVLASRILWSIPAVAAAIALTRSWRETLAAARAPKVFGLLCLSAVLIGINWWVYVRAVAEGRVIEASLAYFITPLVNVAFGVWLFRERLRSLQVVALGLAACGVLVQGLALGAAPWIALALCASWSLYGLVRKQAPTPAAGGLLVETLVLAPAAVAGLFWLSASAPLAQTSSASAFWLMALAGPATAAPLALFAFGARRLRFSTLGVLQFVAPTLQFTAGLLLGEALTPLRLGSFVLIWLGLVVFTVDAWRGQKTSPA